MKYLILLAWMAISAAAFSQGGSPRVYTIAAPLTCEGCEFSNPDELASLTGLRQGNQIQIPGQEFSNAVKALWKQGYFEDISIEIENMVGDKVWLTVKVKERPRISYFDFGGITKTQADDLREQLNFVRGTMWTPEKENKANRVIRNYFVEKGFYNTKVNVIVNTDTNLRGARGVVPRLVVDKGPRIKINDIRVDGNQDFSDKRLVTKMKDIKEKQWWRLWARSKFMPKSFETSKENLINYYRANGYRDAEVLSDSVYNFSDNTINVELKIHEGNQYYIRDIFFTGNLKYSSDTLSRMLGIQRGDIYDQSRLDARLNGDPTGRDISSLYYDEGHLFFNIQALESRVDGDSVDLVILMNEGPRAKVRNVIVEGNTKTSDYVILRECRVLPGDIFSRSNLIRSQREILALGYFDQENFKIQPMPDPATGEVDIKFVVEEKPSDQLQVQGGWGGRIRDADGNTIGGGFVGTVMLGFNNFSTKKFFQKGAWRPVPSGDGQKLNIAVQMNGVGWQNYSISFMEPWLGGRKPNSLGASVFYSINQNPRTDFKMKTLGGSLDFGARLKFPDDFFRSYTTASYKYYDIKNGGQAFNFLQFGDAYINIFSLKQTLDRTSLDAPLFPRTGSQISFSVEGTPPYSYLFSSRSNLTEMSAAEKYKFLEYHKWRFNATWYHPLWKNLILRPKVQFGFLGTYNPQYGTPPFERFFMGGSGLPGFNFYGWEYVALRGYPDNQVGPLDSDGGAQGGSIFSKYSLELRYPITLNQAAPIWVLTFAEAGNTWLGFENFNPFKLNRSAGVGVRVMLPMVGLLGVDWGYGFDPASDNLTQPYGSRFTFLLGQEF